MKAIILAAGMGTRLKPITDKIPKALTRVAGKAILGYQIDALLTNNIKEIIICLGYKPGKIVNFCKVNYPNLNFKFIFNNNYKKTNNMYSFYLTRDFLTDDILLMNGDVIFDSKIIYDMCGKKDSVVAVDKGKYLKESMKIKVDKNGFISDISKIINKDDSFGCSIDLYKFKKNDLKIIKKEIKKIIEKEKNLKLWTEVLLQRLFNSARLHAKALDIKNKKWWEIDDFDDLEIAEKIFNEKIKEIKRKRMFFIDKDGTLTMGKEKVEGADKLINYLNKKKILYRILTNNSSKSPEIHYKELKFLGLNIKKENILLSTDNLIDFLIKNKIKFIHLLANKKVKAYFIKRGFIVNSPKIEAIVLTYDTEINYKKITKTVRLLNSGLPYFASHIDYLCPTEKGFIPDIGIFIKILEISTGRNPDRVFGKPSKDFIIPTLEKYNLKPKNCVLVGDRIYTDIKMTKVLKMLSVLVLSGETKRKEIQFSDVQPDIILKSVNELIEVI
jgi:HAD superfamily hydrolase (TIGR01450 family)